MNIKKRMPISIELDKFTPLGEVSMFFSENLKSIDEIEMLNLTSISNNFVFKVQYSTNVESDEDYS